MAAATTAKADWAYTHWGMTPAQVVKASKGQVPPKIVVNRINKEHNLIGSYSTPETKFSAEFSFDPNNKLITVSLHSISGSCEAYRLGLEKMRGHPIGYGNYQPLPNGFHEEWSSPDGDAIVYEAKGGKCTVDFGTGDTD